MDFGGIVRETCLAYVPDAQVGDTHRPRRLRLNLIDEDEAQKTLELFNEIGLLAGNLATRRTMRVRPLTRPDR